MEDGDHGGPTAAEALTRRIQNDGSEKGAAHLSIVRQGAKSAARLVSQLRPKVRVDIGENYLEEDEWKLGRKGISLDLGQWGPLRRVAPTIPRLRYTIRRRPGSSPGAAGHV
jgi:hypothetical protein